MKPKGSSARRKQTIDRVVCGPAYARTLGTFAVMEESQQPDVDLATISHLVTAARTGDAAAHSEICRKIQQPLNQMADQHLDRQLRRKLNPSDIVQATLTRMVQGFEDFRGSSTDEFYGWLNTILRN